MRKQFEDELNLVLKDYNITGFKILQHWLLKKCNLMAEENYCHFYGFEDNDKLYLDVRGLSAVDLKQLNEFLAENSRSKFQHKLFLSENLLFNRLLPEFRHDLENGFFSAKELNKYQYLSRKFIQNEIVSSIAHECRALQNLLPAFTGQLIVIVENCYDYSSKDFKRLGETLIDFLPIIKQQLELEQSNDTRESLCRLQAALKEFKKTQLTEEKEINKQFDQEMNSFFNGFGIDRTKTDILEFLLFKLAGVVKMPSYASYQLLNGLTYCFKLFFDDDFANLEQLVLDFFQQQGDFTASFTQKKQDECLMSKIQREERIFKKFYFYKNKEALQQEDYLRLDKMLENGKKNREKIGYNNPENGIHIKYWSERCKVPNENPLTSYEFLCDASIFRTNIWPLIQTLFKDILQNSPTELQPYYPKEIPPSPEHIKKKPAKPPQTLFVVAQEQVIASDVEPIEYYISF